MSVRDESAVSLPITRMAHIANSGSRSYLQTRHNPRPNTVQVPVQSKFSVGMRDHDHVSKVRTAWINLVAGGGAPVAQGLSWVGYHQCQLHNATARGRDGVTYGAARRLRAHVNAGVILAENRGLCTVKGVIIRGSAIRRSVSDWRRHRPSEGRRLNRVVSPG